MYSSFTTFLTAIIMLVRLAPIGNDDDLNLKTLHLGNHMQKKESRHYFL